MQEGTTLAADRVLRMLSAVGDTADVSAGFRDRMGRFLTDLASLVHATVAIAVTVRDLPGSGEYLVTNLVTHGLTPAQSKAWSTNLSVTRTDPMLAVLAIEAGDVVRSRGELFDDSSWYAQPGFISLHQAMDLDHCIYSVRSLGVDGWRSLISVHKPADEAGQFTPLDKLTLSLMHRAAARLLDSDPALEVGRQAAGPRSGLTPRLREILTHVLKGRSEKQIAAVLSISRNTVHTHVGSLYRHFQVNGRSELIVKCLGSKRTSDVEEWYTEGAV